MQGMVWEEGGERLGGKHGTAQVVVGGRPYGTVYAHVHCRDMDWRRRCSGILGGHVECVVAVRSVLLGDDHGGYEVESGCVGR